MESLHQRAVVRDRSAGHTADACDGNAPTLPYVRFNSRFRLAQLIDTELAKSGIATNPIAEIDTMTAVVACVVHGLGASVAPYSALKEALARSCQLRSGIRRSIVRLG